MDYSVVIIVLGLASYGLYYCYGQKILHMISGSGSDEDVERDGDQVARIRHGNL